MKVVNERQSDIRPSLGKPLFRAIILISDSFTNVDEIAFFHVVDLALEYSLGYLFSFGFR